MTELLTDNPLLTVFLTVGLGALLGAIPFGPIRLGAAGALFVGLVAGSFTHIDSLQLISSLGLALFVYMVGLAAGQTFFSDLKKQAPIMGWAGLGLVLAAGAAVGIGKLLGLNGDILTGIFAGSLTATPALAAATDATGSGEPSVGYALGYPLGVIMSILLISMVVSKKWPEKNETDSKFIKDVYATSVHVDTTIPVRDVPGYRDETVKMSYLKRGNKTRVISPGEELLPGDEVLFVGDQGAVQRAIADVGKELPDHLANYRHTVDFTYLTVSKNSLAGRSIADLNLVARFGGVATRVRRGDLEMLARDDMHLELGDKILVVAPKENLGQAREFFGDSETSVSSFSALSVGVGMALGLLVGMIEITLPGGSSFSLGAAAGPLVVGMVLGYLQRTGPIVWQIPQAANLTIRQLGLLIFLAAVGISAGPDFFAVVLTATGAQSLVVALAVVLVSIATLWIAGRFSGLSAQRTAGAIAGLIGQPAILSFATSKVNDDRIEAGYAALFAVSIVIKILLVHLILALS